MGGVPLTSLLNAKERQEIEDFARKEAYEIINKKGATYYGIGACVTKMTVSSYDDFTDVYNGFPAILGRNGIIRRLDVKLTEEEGIKLQKSTNAIKKAISETEAA